MKRLTIAMGVGVLAGTITWAQGQPAATTGTRSSSTASATLRDTQGHSIGHVQLRQTPQGVLLKLELKNATPGIHGVHVHEVGRCERPSFESAGGHFNPTGREHGFVSPLGPHAGDLPNIEVPSTKQLSVEYFMPEVTIEPARDSLLDADGAALVIHAHSDDYASEPAGESGVRLACGEFVASNSR